MSAHKFGEAVTDYIYRLGPNRLQVYIFTLIEPVLHPMLEEKY